MITSFLHKLREFPDLLTSCYPDVTNKLRTSKGQGTGNVPTPQESCFAIELEKHGFIFLEKGDTPSANGAYFWYQPNGTQRSIDFILLERYDDKSITVQVDLKHSDGKIFYWNDGWFEKDVVYVISFVLKKKSQIYIGYGETSCSPEETLAIERRRELIKQLNNGCEKVGFLRLYSRQANTYSCERFTKEFCDKQFILVEERLAWK